MIGIGGTVGAVGGMIFSLYTGQVLDRIGSYTPIFADRPRRPRGSG